jgi:hypothetical protein
MRMAFSGVIEVKGYGKSIEGYKKKLCTVNDVLCFFVMRKKTILAIHNQIIIIETMKIIVSSREPYYTNCGHCATRLTHMNLEFGQCVYFEVYNPNPPIW